MSIHKSRDFKPIAWISLFIMIFVSQVETACSDTIFFVRYQIRSENGMITKSILEMIPAADEFRLENFQNITVTGVASGIGEIDVESEAIHNAISRVLVSSGLKSINSRRYLTQSNSGDVAILNYEGVVRFPIQIQRGDAKDAENLYRIKTKIAFSPIAFPTQWSSLYIKHVLKKTAGQISMFLYSAFIQ